MTIEINVEELDLENQEDLDFAKNAIRESVNSSINQGFALYGDNLIGYRAFKEDGTEFDFNPVSDLFRDEELCYYFNEMCFKLRSGEHNDCKFW
jgi:hypothetical protein